jgi:DNA-binding IclR family transcriptional regulator
MKKKQTVAQKILEVLGVHGGLKPKGIIKLTKVNPPSVYTTLNKLRAEKKIAKEEDGVYISQEATSTDAYKKANPTALKDNLVKRIQELAESNGKLTSRVADLESENNRLRHLYMDKNAVVKYLEAKIEEFWSDEL